MSTQVVHGNPEATQDLGADRPRLAAVDVTKVYSSGPEQFRALDGLSLSIEAGQFVAIMGASGSGKSTLLHLFGGLDRPTSGTIRCDGRPLQTLNDAELTQYRRARVGFVFQAFNLVPVLSVRDNVTLPLSLGKVPMKEREAHVDAVLAALDLSKLADRLPSQLSGGQQQRVAVARAIVHDPDVLLADEPTGNLDSVAGEQLIATLREVHQAGGQTTVVVTHDPAVAAAADRIVLIRDGRIIADELLGDPGGTVAEDRVARINEILQPAPAKRGTRRLKASSK